MSTETTRPVAATPKTEPMPPAAAWDALALECNTLATLAEQMRDRVATTGDLAAIIDELRAAHEQVDTAARAVLPLVAEVRRSPYTALHQTMAPKHIAEAFGLGTVTAVYNVLGGRRSATKKNRPRNV